MAKTTAKRRRSSRSRDALSVVLNQALSLFSNPVTLLLSLFALYVIVTVTNNPTDNIVTTIAKKLSAHATTKPVGDWISGHVNETAGLIIYSPACFAVRRYTGILFLTAIFVTLYLPSAKPTEYAIQSLLLFLLATLRSRNAKILVVLAAVLLYYTGFGLSNILGKPE